MIHFHKVDLAHASLWTTCELLTHEEKSKLTRKDFASPMISDDRSDFVFMRISSIHPKIEAEERNYNFNKTKISQNITSIILTATTGQLDFEIQHLKAKLKLRDPKRLKELTNVKTIESHPSFKVIGGKIESGKKF
jgi:hypothetical protein